MILLSSILLACSGGNEEKIETKPVKVTRTVEIAEPAVDAAENPDHEPIQVTLSFESISNLHRGFFMQTAGVQQLGQSLGACFSDRVTVEVSYSNADLRGRILLVSTMDAMECQPSVTKDALDLKSWVPIGRALATFRDYVAGTSDFRISNFQVGIRVEYGQGSCTWMIAGQNPPDGTLWNGCGLVNEAGTCTAKEQVTPHTSFAWNQLYDAEQLRQCLQK